MAKSRRGLRPFDVTAVGPNNPAVHFGTRQGLFRPVMDVDTKALDMLSRNAENKVAQALFKLAIEARNMARAAAPVRTGMLRQGIYVTRPSGDAHLKELRAGRNVAAQNMLGHTRGYYDAISAIAAKAGRQVPGEGSGGEEEFLIPRTQRLRTKVRSADGKGFDTVTRADFESMFTDSDKGDFYFGDTATLLPYNPIGKAGRSAFFVGLGSAMYYSAWVEYGTSRARGKYFFTPVAHWMAAQAPRVVTQVFRELRTPYRTRAAIRGR